MAGGILGTGLLAGSDGVLGLLSTASSLNVFGVGFTLGPFNFVGTEVPERLSGLAGTHRVATHEFPGGFKTLQTFGAFPEVLSFKGVMSGGNAISRIQQLDRLRVTGQLVVLAYAQFSYMGVVTEFKPEPMHQWRVPYTLTFEPVVDLSGGNNGLSAETSLDQNLANQMNGLTGLLSGSPFNLPAGLLTPVTNLVSTVNTALVSAGQVVSMTVQQVSAIAQVAGTVVTAASGLINSASALVSSPALDATAYSTSIANIVQTGTTSTRTIQVVNPNLFMLAAQYYGDQNKWTQIAAANNLIDPMPIGSFTLVIP